MGSKKGWCLANVFYALRSIVIPTPEAPEPVSKIHISYQGICQHYIMSFALRAFGRQAKQTGRVMRDPMQMQQKRLMSGGEDDGVHRVNWWDAPTNPDM